MGKWGADGTNWLPPHGLRLGKDGGPPGCSQGADCIPVLVRFGNASMGHEVSSLTSWGGGEGPRGKLSLTQGRWRQALCGDAEAQGSNLWALQL